MKKGLYQKSTQSKYKWIIALVFALCILLITILIVLLLRPIPIQAVLPNGQYIESTSEVEKNENSIAIPGYEGINLIADKKQQTVGIPNPAQNTCYFRITLLLEDGTVLWQSDIVKPGEISDPILLNQTLPKGTYPNAVLKFDCYTMDGSMTPLNGAATKLTLRFS